MSVKVTILGIRNASSGCCSPSKTMGEMYDELVQFIEHSDVSGEVETEFIDASENDLSGYEKASSLIERGYRMPLTLINGTPRFYGGIANEMIYNEIKKYIITHSKQE